MATGNMLLGLARKKLGDVVFYRSEGQQRSRVRVRDVKNPRSAKQSVQRMVLATAAKMAAAYEPIVNHSFEGVAAGVSSVRHFRSLAMQSLRNAAALAINYQPEDPNPPVAYFAIKGAPIVGALKNLTISRGSLNMVPYSFVEGAFGVEFTATAAPITTQAAYEAELAKIGLLPGDQLTLVMLFQNNSIPVATFGQENNYAQAVRMARVTFVPEIPANFSGTLISEGKFNPLLVERVQGSITAATQDGRLELSCDPGDLGNVISACLIRSQIQANGKFKYSSADMAVDAEVFDENNADAIYPSYMDNAEEIIVGDTLYLQNAVASFE